MAPLVALFSRRGNTQLAQGSIFRHAETMAVDFHQAGRRPLFSSLLCASLSVLLLGAACETSSKEASPATTTAPKTGAPAPPSEPESKDEGLVEDTPQAHPVVATETASSPAEFADTAPPEFKKAFETLNIWVTSHGGKVHAALVDLEADTWLLRADSRVAVNPASNAKVLTAAAALELLGPAYQFKTELFGEIDAEGHCARLVLKGGGAPDLTTADLWRLLRVARGEGLVEVGELVVDQTRFSDRFVPPAFDQQPGEWAPFRAPISALALNENTVTLNVVSTRAGEAARVWYDPPGIVVEKGQVMISAAGAGDTVTWNIDPKTDAARPISLVGGKLAEKLGRRRYARRMEDPRLAGGYALAELLKESGVLVKGKVSLGTQRKEPRLAVWNSEPVAKLVRALGKDSNNFVAEMLFVALSQMDGTDTKKSDPPWSSERGAVAVMKWLKEKKLDLKDIVMKNGSGLFDANLLSAELLTSVLAQIEENPRIYQDFVSHLAMGSTDGTMKKRMRSSEIGARVRAKTGTLNGVDALTGYVQRPGGKSPAAFSVIVVGSKLSHGEVRNRVDAMVLSWAKSL